MPTDPFVHTVFFWLNRGTPPEAQAQLLNDAKTLLGPIPGVTGLYAGPPANTPRDVVDNSYGIGLTVVMKDRDAHDVYQSHPLHLEFIARNKAHWQRVQIYDFQ